MNVNPPLGNAVHAHNVVAVHMNMSSECKNVDAIKFLIFVLRISRSFEKSCRKLIVPFYPFVML